MKEKEKIIVAMSGGVDSAVAAGLLMEAGYDVIGVNLRTWEYEAPACDTTKKSCCSPEDIRDARDVGLSLNIPFYVIKMEKVFGERVIDRFINDYKDGRTPNPCVECNTFVKFGALFEQAKILGIEKIATGHYARVVEVDGRYAIRNAVDMKKNQAYYLYGLSQENIKNTVFPLGEMDKAQVREIAKRMGLPVAEKPESQEICFIPENDYRSFLKKKGMEFTPGFFKLASGQIIGKHQGKEGFTIGQRKGLGIAWKNPLYVLAIEDDGTVVLGEEEETVSESFILEEITYQALSPMEVGDTKEMKVQIRYRSAPVHCKVTSLGNTWKVEFLEDVKSVTPGQSATFYETNGDYLLAGGIIQKGSITRKVKTNFVLEAESVTI
ncbi:tRNA 2-thiouridine(34) synthase MnmA [Leptospira bandrabouensis]|uniref:tRNA-specific 2-thiouridylase MnmA n=1 Tax=Leptospira bandrabouensis TaxID=2484903 RepID=A0A6H3NSS2_9LEPT|nr:tRNA 2-thiouridine(34) synthase MnmA [Leptospira bandrabouensis]MCG6145204.1 tRNA 2-thiouridine(34) synthase MnmA [Leptospira bandrabouensis]MCG6161475.1 tRNA 2-thiouridine(34) synthase MnmA [Leptospira bandrabouensis]MCG6165048.1 tRNA 2-thiouridine(34) synthase MnmA [Leptospira bandrabouensis]TGN07826.1 tRNA 2-thiouridine(34) synthase MnmA [Leptospira bandrabouensis]TGN13062.1 tRNA 2-thiouridine(34) synthase MnmA [Leptospira bandrabouensis]